MKIVKYLIFIFNLIVFVAGIAMIILGSVIQAEFSGYYGFFGNDVNSAAVFIIVIGIIIVIISFFGCCGAYRESHWMLITFSVLLSIVFVLEIAAAITALVLDSELQGFVNNSMMRTLTDYGVNESADWDQMQSSMECCGVNSYLDWAENPEYNKENTVPDSCCIDDSSRNCAGKVLKTNDTSNIYTEGCATKMTEWIEENMELVIGISAALAVLQIVGVVLACVLASAIRQQYQPV